MDLITACLRFWPLISFFVGLLLYLGALHQLVKNNNKAIARLFNDMERLHDFSIRQDTITKEQEKRFSEMMVELRDYVSEAVTRYTALGVRIDDLFKLLGKRKDD